MPGRVLPVAGSSRKSSIWGRARVLSLAVQIRQRCIKPAPSQYSAIFPTTPYTLNELNSSRPTPIHHLIAGNLPSVNLQRSNIQTQERHDRATHGGFASGIFLLVGRTRCRQIHILPDGHIISCTCRTRRIPEGFDDDDTLYLPCVTDAPTVTPPGA